MMNRTRRGVRFPQRAANGFGIDGRSSSLGEADDMAIKPGSPVEEVSHTTATHAARPCTVPPNSGRVSDANIFC